MDASHAPNINHLWAALLVDELVRQGVTFFVVCPGSRSTPLAVAVGEHPQAEALVHWDERAAAFVALGWGRATGHPAAVVTTSGTAVANLLPAAVEADADGVPLLLLTADRPPELRETGANQTVRQPPVFQDVARWALDWPVPTPDVPARWVLSTAAHAVHRALAPPGPVHLNLPFREPLGRQPDGLDGAAYLDELAERGRGGARAVRAARIDGEPFEGATEISGVAATLREVERGLVILAAPGQAGQGAERLASALGWPLLVDVRARGAAGLPAYDLALASARFRAEARPEAVVHIGGRLTSKRLGQLVAAARPSLYVQLTETAVRSDPDSVVSDRLVGPLEVSVAALARSAAGDPRPPSSWQGAWEAAAAAAAGCIDALSGLSEVSVARQLARREGPLVAAASMPIRDLLAVGAQGVTANRGASGIDGTVATAHGVARGSRQPVTLLIGDLALLHDQTSLALLRDGPPVTVVCINNDGGGIFHRLPIADGPGALAPDTFERLFGTPHGLAFEHAARQVGLAYHAPDTLEAFEEALAAARGSGASALIEVRTNREAQAALRRQLEAAAAAAVDAALGAPDVGTPPGAST